jgi:predicted O-methyltransferase YrrM
MHVRVGRGVYDEVGEPMETPLNRDVIRQHVRDVIDDLLHTGVVVSDTDGTTHTIFPVAISAEEGEALRTWVVQEGATHTIEIGLGYGVSALHICEGLVANDPAAARHVVIDPFQ